MRSDGSAEVTASRYASVLSELGDLLGEEAGKPEGRSAIERPGQGERLTVAIGRSAVGAVELLGEQLVDLILVEFDDAALASDCMSRLTQPEDEVIRRFLPRFAGRWERAA